MTKLSARKLWREQRELQDCRRQGGTMAAVKPNVDLVERFYHETWNCFGTQVIPEIAHPDTYL